MESLPAEEFVKRYVSAYGESWNEVLSMMTEEAPCAKHMAEFIDDIEAHGQQTPVYIDETGCVSEGNKIVLAQQIMNQDILFKYGPEPEPNVDNLFIVEFDVESGNMKYLKKHASEFFSFRVGPDWVYPFDANGEDDEFYAVMYCPSGGYIADRLEPVLAHRLPIVSGIDPISFRVSQLDVAEVDEDGPEW